MDIDHAELVRQIRDGSEAARDKLIVALTPLCKRMVKQDVSKAGDDETSAALVALVAAVDDLRTNNLDADNIVFELMRIARRAAIGERDNNGFGPTANAKALAASRGATIDAPSLMYTPPAHLTGPVVDDAYAMIDLVDELRACCQCEAEKQTLELTITGHAPKEISAQLSIPGRTVYHHLHSIRNRYKARNDA